MPGKTNPPSKFLVMCSTKFKKADSESEARRLARQLSEEFKANYPWNKRQAHIYAFVR